MMSGAGLQTLQICINMGPNNVNNNIFQLSRCCMQHIHIQYKTFAYRCLSLFCWFVGLLVCFSIGLLFVFGRGEQLEAIVCPGSRRALKSRHHRIIQIE